MTGPTSLSDVWEESRNVYDGVLSHISGYAAGGSTISQALRRLAAALEEIEDHITVIALKVDYQGDVVDGVRVTALYRCHDEVQKSLCPTG